MKGEDSISATNFTGEQRRQIGNDAGRSMSSWVSFATTGRISSALAPARAPILISLSWRKTYIGERPVRCGTSPMPFRSGPWHVAQGSVWPSPPLTRASPRLMLPTGTLDTKPIRESRKSARSGACGNSMMRLPIGSVPPSSTANRIPPVRNSVFGTVSVSTTLFHEGTRQGRIISGGFAHFLVAHGLGDWQHRAGTPALAMAIFEVGHLADDIGFRQAGEIG